MSASALSIVDLGVLHPNVLELRRVVKVGRDLGDAYLAPGGVAHVHVNNIDILTTPAL